MLWVERCRKQVSGVLDFLEADLVVNTTRFWCGDVINRADIAVTYALRQMREAIPESTDDQGWPNLDRHCGFCEDLPFSLN